MSAPITAARATVVTPPGETVPAPRLTVARVLGAALRQGVRPALCADGWKILNALLACRTPMLGAHQYRCADCGGEHLVPHLAAIATVRPVRGRWRMTGWSGSGSVCCRCPIFMGSSLCRTCSIRSLRKTGVSCSICSSAVPVPRCWSSDGIAGKQGLGSPPCCTPGARRCWIIIICIALSPAEACAGTAAAGVARAAVTSSPSRRSPKCFGQSIAWVCASFLPGACWSATVSWPR